jgi:dihydrodipicolinate synthase/N-acetylneuraminate lyase
VNIDDVTGDTRVIVADAMESSEVHDQGARVLLEVMTLGPDGWTQACAALSPELALKIGEELARRAREEMGR